jgi:hypothetical protein
MIEFKKLTLQDIDDIKPYLSKPSTRSCDNTVGCTLMWRNFFHTEYAIINETAIFKVDYFNYRGAFSTPIGSDVPGALKAIWDFCVRHNMKMIICAATGKDVSLISSQFKARVIKEDGWSDYIYRAVDLAFMAGRRFSGQRNHMNRFKRENPGYEFKKIDNSTIPDVRSFFEEYCRMYTKDSDMYRAEEDNIFEVLDNYDLYGQSGVALYAGGRVVAFAIGEVLGDTLFVHIEKADTRVSGSYQMIASEYVKMNLDCGIKFVNREEDLGDEGLRNSKLQYHPCGMVDKYAVIIDTKY